MKFTHTIQNTLYKNGKIYTPDEITKIYNDKSVLYLYEYVEISQNNKPYFDIDDVITEKLSDAEIISATNSKITESTAILNKLFNQELTFAIEHASGYDKTSKGIKISIHLVIQDFIVNHLELKELLDRNNLFPYFDKKVYRDGESKFRVGGFSPINKNRQSHILKGAVTDFLVGNISDTDTVRDLKTDFNLKVKSKSKITEKKITTNIIMNDNISISSKYKSEVIELLTMIGSIDDYDTYLKITAIIKNTDVNLKPIWDSWCQKSSKYNKDTNNQLWDRLSENGSLKLKSLHYIARHTNPDEYFLKNHFQIFNEYWNEDHYGMAKIYCELFHNEIKCIDQQKGMFYIYDRNTSLWSLKNERCISSVIRENLYPCFHRYIKYIEKSDSVTEKTMEKIKCITQISKKLNSVSFTKNICSELSGFNDIYEPDFTLLLGKQKDILSVKNGIIELKTGKLRKREVFDYVVEYLDIDYNENDINKDWIYFINDIFDNDQIQNKEAVVDYLQIFLGYSITGHTTQQKMLINFGCGSNGKTVQTNIINQIFDKYTENIKAEVLDKNITSNNANSASPELSKLFLKRLGIINESEDTMTLGKQFKSLVDSANITARPLYGNPFKMELTSQFILNTNNLPHFPQEDSYIRRMLTVPFYNCYKRKEDMSGNDKEIDKNLESRILQNKSGVLKWFVDGAKRYYKNNEILPDEPSDLQTAKNKYIEENDISRAFEFTDNPKDFIPTREIERIIEQNYGIIKKKKELKDILTKKGAKSGKGFGDQTTWNGYRHIKSVHYDITADNPQLEFDEY